MPKFEGFQRADPKDDDATKRAKSIHNSMMYCQHYDGRALFDTDKKKRKCLAGVCYDDVGDTARERPCLGGHLEKNPLASCIKWVRVTEEQAIARWNELQEALRRMRLVGPAVKKWRTWTPSCPVAKHGSIPCPTGCGGTLHLSQAALNGHVWGKCTTTGCVSWME